MRLPEFEAGGLKRADDCPCSKVVTDKGDMLRFGGNPAPERAGAASRLGRGMIEFEDAHVLGRLEPIGESIEARAHDQDLSDAFFNGSASRVLRETAAHGDEQTQGTAAPALLVSAIA